MLIHILLIHVTIHFKIKLYCNGKINVIIIISQFYLSEEANRWTGSPLCDVIGGDGLRLEDGQAVQLEDGTTAYIHTPKGLSQS